MAKDEGAREEKEEETNELFDDGWAFEALEAALFAGVPHCPEFRLRAAVFLGKDEYRLGPVSEDDYLVPKEERAQIAAAFRGAFPEEPGSVPTESGDGDVLAGSTTVEAKSLVESWNLTVRDLHARLSESPEVRDPLKAIHAIDFLFLEIREEGMFEQLVARALSGEISGETAPLSDTEGDATSRHSERQP